MSGANVAEMEVPQLRVGCAMWADRRWVGTYFPADTPVGRELAAYQTWCTAVEGNTTFYGLPSPSTVERWAADAPPSFRFMFKLPRVITHEKRLRNTEADVADVLERLAPLGGRAAPLSVQLPGSFGPADLGVLGAFLERAAQHGGSWAVEVRHPDFCAGGTAERTINDLLAEHGAERIIIDTRAVFAGPRQTPAEVEAFERKPRLPVRPVAIGRNPVVRFIGQTKAEANPAWWAKWVPKVAQWLDEGRSPMFFVHTPDNAVAPALARRFHHEVAALVPHLPPLPDPATAASQLRLLP
jgi:uncharacterized protein YecE (DUF72 family)